MKATQKTEAYEVVVDLVRAMYPVTWGEIERELMTQCCAVNNREQARHEAVKAVNAGIQAGVLMMDGDCIDLNR